MRRHGVVARATIFITSSPAVIRSISRGRTEYLITVKIRIYWAIHKLYT
jgi:hypothetical protein